MVPSREKKRSDPAMEPGIAIMTAAKVCKRRKLGGNAGPAAKLG